jgi:hypothetical protein
LRRDRLAALVVALLLFPLLFAAQPGTWFWEDGRYIVFLGPLLALILVGGIEEMLRRARHRGARLGRRAVSPFMVASAAIVVVGVLTTAAFNRDNNVGVRSYTSGWSDPNAPVNQSIALLQAGGVRAGFADYWVAYKVDLLNSRMTITPAPGDVDRSAAIDRVVERAREQAWLFVPSEEIPAGYVQFSPTAVIAGPGAVTEPAFIAALDHLGVAHRMVRAGLLDAVVPARPVTIQEVRAAGG